MGICALEIAIQSVYTHRKMIADVLAVILLAQNATGPTMMNALIVMMDLFV
jgi:hypothetical protein